MGKLLVVTLLLTLCSSPSLAAQSVSADFIDISGEKIGTASLQEMGGGTLITIDASLSEGTHAIHIHEKAACDAPDFKTAGGHFNPENHQHGFTNVKGFHAGDLPNLHVEPSGHITAEIFAPNLHLSGKDGIGHGVTLVIHEKADDYSSDPSGNAGARIACASIKQ